MIIETSGGVGNQLFQYAFAHFLVDNHFSTKVSVRPGFHTNDREFVLDGIFAHCEHVSISQKQGNSKLSRQGIVRGLLRRVPRFRYILLCLFNVGINYSPFGVVAFRQVERELRRRHVLPLLVSGGYFQSWFYFFNQSDCMLQRLTAKLKSVEQIGEEPELIVHIRRGDYLTGADVWGPIDLSCFQAVIDDVRRSQKVNHVSVFSDDYDAALEMVSKFENAIAHDPDTVGPLSLLSSASKGQFLIASNSSLSIWASFLMLENSIDPLVLIPDQWQRNLGTEFLGIMHPKSNVFPVTWEISL